MKISKQEVAKIADLARLEVDEHKLELFAEQLSNILQYMEQLNELDTENVNPLYSPVEHSSIMREDTVYQEYSREEIIKNAPEEDGRYFIVPKVF